MKGRIGASSSSAARKMLTLVLLAQSASAFTVVGRTAVHKLPVAPRSSLPLMAKDLGGGVDKETVELWRPGEAVDPARNLLQLLDMWEEESDGDAEECSISDSGDNAGCCMLGPEPLAGLCDRLDMASEAPELTKLFELVLKEAADFHDSSSEGAEFGTPCVTVEKMRSAIRDKVAKRIEAGTSYYV